MTVAELIEQLATQNPDTPVRLVVSDEFSSGPAADLGGWQRVVLPTGVHIELWGEL